MSHNLDLQHITNQIADIARSTGLWLKSERAAHRPDVFVKGKNDFVTNMDRKSEEIIVDKLAQLLPEAGFIAEEGTRSNIMPVYNWIVDPIDGTTNFIHGLSPFAISIGLKRHDDIVSGVVYEIGMDELFCAWKDGGAYLNGNKIEVSKTPEVANSLIATGFPYNNFDRMEGYMKSLEYLMQNCSGLRRLGSAATDLAYTACGRFDAFYEYDLKPHDVAAGILLVKEAGGAISDFKGGNDYLFGGTIIASNNNIKVEFQQIIQSAF